MSCFLSMNDGAGRGPCKIFDAATRSDFIAATTRASSDDAIVGTGAASSAACCTVHLPVPFMPVASRITSTSRLAREVVASWPGSAP